MDIKEEIKASAADPPKKREAGLQWEKFKVKSVTSEDLAAALRQRDIRTAKDLQRNTRQVLGILLSLHGTTLADLMEFAKEGK